MKLFTQKQIHKKYKDKYIEVLERPFWDTDKQGNKLYEVHGVYSQIHENTTLGQDVGTTLAYTR